MRSTKRVIRVKNGEKVVTSQKRLCSEAEFDDYGNFGDDDDHNE
jgi:hypothetical protein